jgi:hypothetical protein
VTLLIDPVLMPDAASPGTPSPGTPSPDAPLPDAPPPGNGTWADAEALRRWSFQRRTPQQRLDWLVEALTLLYSIRESQSARGSAPSDAARITDE